LVEEKPIEELVSLESYIEPVTETLDTVSLVKEKPMEELVSLESYIEPVAETLDTTPLVEEKPIEDLVSLETYIEPVTETLDTAPLVEEKPMEELVSLETYIEPVAETLDTAPLVEEKPIEDLVSLETYIEPVTETLDTAPLVEETVEEVHYDTLVSSIHEEKDEFIERLTKEEEPMQETLSSAMNQKQTENLSVTNADTPPQKNNQYVSWLKNLKKNKQTPKEEIPVKKETPVQNEEDDNDTEHTEVQALAENSLIENEEIISETLAKVLAMQGKKEKAKQMYQKLILKFPKKSSYFAELIEKLGI
jgi:S-DNA-T family DNA segregation ATPase FtsK/SpoIIIE